jgi:PIN domain nuclease of toxin-antitoxin system
MSTVNVWEISIKSSLGKLPMPPDGPRRLRAVADSTRFAVLPVTVEHAFAVRDLPWHHRDPFDRLLVAQARTEGMTLVSDDEVLSRYGVDVLW